MDGILDVLTNLTKLPAAKSLDEQATGAVSNKATGFIQTITQPFTSQIQDTSQKLEKDVSQAVDIAKTYAGVSLAATVVSALAAVGIFFVQWDAAQRRPSRTFVVRKVGKSKRKKSRRRR